MCNCTGHSLALTCLILSGTFPIFLLLNHKLHTQTYQKHHSFWPHADDFMLGWHLQPPRLPLSCIWDCATGLWFGSWRAGRLLNEGSHCCSRCQALPCSYLCLRHPWSFHPAHPSQSPVPLDFPSKSLCSTHVWPGRSSNIQQQHQVRKSIKWGVTWKVYWQIHGFPWIFYTESWLTLEDHMAIGELTWYYTREDTDSW